MLLPKDGQPTKIWRKEINDPEVAGLWEVFKCALTLWNAQEKLGLKES